MVWIKRNLYFVISAAVGLLLTGYCAYLLYSSLNENAEVSTTYESTLANLQQIQQKSPYPSTENIQAARADQEHVRVFLTDFKKCFAPFPPPPVKDEKGFKTYLEDSLVQFRAEATNAGVQLPPDYGFAFSGLMGKLTYPPANIGPWMQQLEEISTLLDILYHAKINYLAGLQRVPVSPDDTGIGDCLQAATVTNVWGNVTPYKITFRGFSTEIAAVLEGFARSSNCFIIKSIDVAPDKSVQPVVQTAAQAQTTYVQPQNPNLAQNRMQYNNRGIPGLRVPMPAPVVAVPVVLVPAAAASTPPVTILSESPLLVTVSVDVVKLKGSEH